MSELPVHTPESDEVAELFALFLDQRLDETGHQRLETLLREDPTARERCARRLLFEADLKNALDPDEVEWLETRRVTMGRRDGRPAMEILRSQELRVGPRSRTSGSPLRKRQGIIAASAGVCALLIAAAVVIPKFRHSATVPVLQNAGFETTDLSLNPTGDTTALIEWQDYFTTDRADLCEIARMTEGRIFAKSGRNVARLKSGGHLTQRLRDERGTPITAQPNARYVLTGWVYAEGKEVPHLLRVALRVVASGRPAMIQYEAVNRTLEIPVKPGWQPFRFDLNLGENLDREPSDITTTQRPALDLKGREMTLSIDSRGATGSLFYLDDVSLEVKDGDG